MKLEKYIPRPDPIPWDNSFSPTVSSIQVRSEVQKIPIHGTSSKRVNIFFFRSGNENNSHTAVIDHRSTLSLKLSS